MIPTDLLRPGQRVRVHYVDTLKHDYVSMFEGVTGVIEKVQRLVKVKLDEPVKTEASEFDCVFEEVRFLRAV